MLLMAEKGIRGGICRYAKANNKYMKSYNKKILLSYLMYLDANNLYGWEMSHKLPANGLKCVERLSKLGKRFIKNNDESSDKGYFLKVDVEYPKNLFDLHFKEMKLKNVISLFVTYKTKKTFLFT